MQNYGLVGSTDGAEHTAPKCERSKGQMCGQHWAHSTDLKPAEWRRQRQTHRPRSWHGQLGACCSHGRGAPERHNFGTSSYQCNRRTCPCPCPCPCCPLLCLLPLAPFPLPLPYTASRLKEDGSTGNSSLGQCSKGRESSACSDFIQETHSSCEYYSAGAAAASGRSILRGLAFSLRRFNSSLNVFVTSKSLRHVLSLSFCMR